MGAMLYAVWFKVKSSRSSWLFLKTFGSDENLCFILVPVLSHIRSI